MPRFTWDQYLRLSKSWFAQVSSDPGFELSEAIYRNIISRAYYSALNHARLYVTHLDRDPLIIDFSRDESTHKKVIDHLNTHKRAQAAVYLGRLKEQRVKCDYHDIMDKKTTWSSLCQESIEQSEYIFKSLEVLQK